MTAATPQYFRNTLVPVQIDDQTLQDTLRELRLAVRRGVTIIEENTAPPNPNDVHAFGSIYNGDLGIALMALRLERQAEYLCTADMPIESFISKVRNLAATRINPHIQKVSLHPGRLSPIGSASLGAAVVRILAGILELPSTNGGHHRIHNRDIAILCDAVSTALSQGDLSGGDEVLYGRAGLLLALLNIRTLATGLHKGSKELLAPLFQNIAKLVDVIVSAGVRGSQDYETVHGNREALPLMWPWHEKFYTGAIHGVCGPLAVLLTCNPDEAANSYPLIAQTINALCRMCISHNGHLPSSLPAKPSPRPSPLVQICHGAPGILILLSHARNNPEMASKYWCSEWDEALKLSSQRVWEQGLLYKGGGLCHGIAGNAWPFLLLHDSLQYGGDMGSRGDESLVDMFLSRGLTFLLHARQTQPFKRHGIGGGLHYRMPDAPYSLFEGLAGTVTAWADACVVISARLKAMGTDQTKGLGASRESSEFRSILSAELGIPAFSARGFL
ncbi:hypothetical protein VTO42DRAFT_8113 [Malbranchea cinnamomea]